MSSVSSVGGSPVTYTPAPKAPPKSSSTPTAPVADHDHDGDTDGPGIDVKG